MSWDFTGLDDVDSDDFASLYGDQHEDNNGGGGRQRGAHGQAAAHFSPTVGTHGSTPPRQVTPASHDSHEFVTLDDDEDDDDDDMPPRRRRQPSAVVDLTATSPLPARQAKRKRSTDTSRSREDSGAKRRRQSAEDIEELDLSNEAPSAEEELLQAQQQDAIRAQQQAAEDSAPQKIGNRQCIICLENYTNCTVTACGHFFCHECLMQALVAAAKNNDRQTGSCPVCRKSLSQRKKGDVIPIAFMTKKEYDKNYKGRRA